ncbi:MAG: glycosyltransferase [Nitrospirae bacterium]|jgi:glycosyltransferase involved in cell wall biosynthesis|nr:glycosyltransferase [Nitrospirota bacterium]
MISVIIPFFRAGAFLGEAIESVLDQTEQDWELILVDNNASDDTRQVAEKYARKNSDRIRIVHEPQQGNAFARNHGIMHAQGEFIAFLDDDDIMYPDRLHLQKTALKKRPEASLAYGLIDRVSQDNQKILSPSVQSFPFMHFIKCSPSIQECIRLNFPDIPPSALFLSKKILSKSGFFDSHLTPFFLEDTDFCMRLYQSGPFLQIEKSIIRFRMPSSDFLKKKRKKTLDRYRILQNQDYFYSKVVSHIRHKEVFDNFEVQKSLSEWRARWIKEIGMSFLGLKDGVPFARALFIRSLFENPNDISILKHFFRSFHSYGKRFSKYGDIQLQDEGMPPEITSSFFENLFTGKHSCEFCSSP